MAGRWNYGDGQHTTTAATDAPAAAPASEGPARLLSAVLDALSDGVIVTDQSGRFLYFNAAARRLLGTEPADAPLGDWPLLYGLYRPDTGALFDADDLPLVRAVRGEACQDVEVLVRNALVPEGALWSITSRPLGDAPGVVIVLRDVTARLRAQQELRHSRERLALAVDGSTDGVWDWDVARAAVYFSPRWKAMLGYADHEIAGRFEEWSGRLHPEDRQRALQTIDDYLNGRIGEYALEHRLRHKDGSYRWILARGVAVRDAAGRICRMAGSHTDVTARRRQEENLRRARDAAEQANRAKNEFLANVSHELRTPLNAILGMTELTLDAPLTPDQRGNLHVVQSSTQDLLAVIDNLLDFVKIESGQLDLTPREFALDDALGDALRMLAPRAHAKGLELAYRVDAAVPDCLVGDWGRLRQVVTHLVGNAVKFTERGEVVVSVSLAPDDKGTRGQGDKGKPSGPLSPCPLVPLSFEVRDTGIGVPLEKQRMIFDPFVQADGSMSRKYGGAGLGLAISARVVEAMGGRLWVESVPGCGSIFQFTVPLAAPGGLAAGQPADMKGWRILVVDDNASQRRILAEMLADRGAEAETAADAEAALAALRPAEGPPFRAVLLDAGLPGAERVAAAAAAVMVRLLTAADRPQGPDDPTTLMKPVKPSELSAALRRATDGSAPAPAAAPEPAPRLSRPLRVLIAEDHPINQKLAVALVRKLGCSTALAGDGAETLAALGRETFDAVLMDVQMPGLDGFATTARIRAAEAGDGRRTPIIAVTAHALKGDRERCLAAGMDGYLSKPVSARELYLALAAVADGATSPPAPAPQADVPMTHSPPPSSDFRRDVALARVGGDEGLLRELTADYRRDAPKWLDDLRQAVARGDAAAVRIAAHTIKGAVGYFGADEAGALADRLQELGRAGDPAGAAAVFPQLEQALGRLGAALRALDSNRPPSLEDLS